MTTVNSRIHILAPYWYFLTKRRPRKGDVCTVDGVVYCVHEIEGGKVWLSRGKVRRVRRG